MTKMHVCSTKHISCPRVKIPSLREGERLKMSDNKILRTSRPKGKEETGDEVT
jgi:hypothetical protein